MAGNIQFNYKWFILYAVALFVYGWVFAFPLHHDVKAIEGEVHTAERELQEMGEAGYGVSKIKNLYTEVLLLRSKAEQTQREITVGMALEPLLLKLTAILGSSDVGGLRINQLPVKDLGEVQVLPLNIRFQGRSVSAFEVLGEVESMRRLVQVNTFEMKKDQQSNTLDVTIGLDVYFYAADQKRDNDE